MNSVDWLYFDLNSYFASVEQQDAPDLRGKPVAIVPMPTDATCAIAASYEAKAYGVKTGTKIYDAKKLCPSLTCVLARHDRYVHYHDLVIKEIVKHTPIHKIWSIDECSSRLLPNKRPVDQAIDLAQRIKKGIWENVGEAINCSIGLAPTGLLAKIAGDMQKPDGLTVITKESLPGPLLDLKLIDLPGIGANIEKRLNRAGIWSVKQFWDTSPKQARKIWGSVQGERFWYALHGYEVPDLETSPRMVGHSRMLDPNLRAPEQAKQITRRLTIKAAQRLRRKGFYATHFMLKVRTTEWQKWGAEVKHYTANDSITFLKLLDNLWAQMMTELRPQRLIKTAIILHGLRDKQQLNYDLFDHGFQRWQKVQVQRDKLSSVIEELNKKHGPNTINLGTSPKTIAGYVGTKIAFSRVPDQAEFFE